MASLNKVLIMGNLGKDPEVRQTQGGKSVANFSIATSQKWTDDKGQAKETTEWHRVIVWGKLAEVCGKYLARGRSCLVEGRLQTRKYQNKQGIEHYTTEIIADNVVFVGSGDRSKKEEDYIDTQASEVDRFQDVPF